MKYRIHGFQLVTGPWKEKGNGVINHIGWETLIFLLWVGLGKTFGFILWLGAGLFWAIANKIKYKRSMLFKIEEVK